MGDLDAGFELYRHRDEKDYLLMNVNIENPVSGVRVLTIDRPPVNALNEEIVDELRDAVKAAMLDGRVRVLVITGAGKIFVAGADLDRLLAADMDAGRKMADGVKGLHREMRQGGKPVIAAINGMAAGGGLELAMACDVRIADQNARMGLPEVTLGVLPGAGGTQMLPRLVGAGKAMEMMFTGMIIDANDALQLGLVEQVAIVESALDLALKMAARMVKNAPLAISEIKAAVYDTMSLPLDQGLAEETGRFARLCRTADKNEGITAFKSRRTAVFKGI